MRSMGQKSMNKMIKLLVTFSFSLALTGCLIPTKELVVYENSVGMKQGAEGVYDIEVPVNEDKTLKGSVALCGDNNDYNMIGYAQDYKTVFTFKGDYVPSKVSGQDGLYILAFRDLEVVKHDIGEEIKSDSKTKYSLAFYKHDGDKLTVWSRDAISEDDAKKSPEDVKSIIERTVNSKLSSTLPLMRSTNQKPCSTLLGDNYKELKEIIAAKKSKKNYKTKEELLKSACDKDDMSKCAELAGHYINRKNNKEEKLSLKYYDLSCKNGHVESCFHLAKEYRLGDCDGLFCSKNSLITKDLIKSDKYFDLICNRKYKEQCSNIVTFLLENSSRIGSYKFDDSSEESIVKYYMVSNESLSDDLLMELNVTVIEEKDGVTTILTGDNKMNYTGVFIYWFKNGKSHLQNPINEL